jgi:phospholipase/carboxylesterase
MISLQTGIKRKNKINSIIGYSGKIIDTNHLQNNINSRPNIILMHGDKDEIVPVSFLLESKEFFNKNNYKVESKIFINCEHRIPTEGSSLGLEFLKKNLY